MTHPGEEALALHAGGDLGFLERVRMSWHLRRCEACRSEVDSLQAAIAEMRAEAAEWPSGINWHRLASEMTANIHVGLEAGECVGPVREPAPRVAWRAAAVTAGLFFMVLAAWWLNPVPKPQTQVLRASPRVEIRTTASGIELNENGAALTILHRTGRDNVKPLIWSSPGTLRARFVDAETGQVTINHVYAE